MDRLSLFLSIDVGGIKKKVEIVNVTIPQSSKNDLKQNLG